MPAIELEINDRELADLIRTLQRLDMQRLAVDALKVGGETIESKTRVYPPQPAGSHYRRKVWAGGLISRWYHRAFPTYLEIGNLATYAGWVHGEEQVETHRQTGWKRLLQVATDELPEIIRKVEAQVERIWRGNA